MAVTPCLFKARVGDSQCPPDRLPAHAPTGLPTGVAIDDPQIVAPRAGCLTVGNRPAQPDRVTVITAQPHLESGDRVRLRADLGGFFWPRIRRGTTGIIIAPAADSRYRVHLTGDNDTELVPGDLLELA